jgi:DNA-directed RNA polymerase specialized sigma24 family protein
MDRFDQASDEKLLRLTAQEPEAFGAFYRRHVAAVLAYARRRTGSPELAFDLTAEVFAAALESSRRYRPGNDSGAGPRLYGIARNKVADSVRRGRIEEREYDEIAARLDCSPQVVRKRVSRGLAALRARVDGET